jgi:hemoglobin
MSIYDSIGGADAVKAAVDDFYLRVTADPELTGYFAGTDMNRLKSHQRAFIAAAVGGPELYQGRDLAAAHAPLAITDAHFDRVVGHLVATLGSLGVPAETITTIGETLAPLRPAIVTTPSEVAN